MRIYSMTATFGKLEHETLTLQPGLNVIQAPNEWGKSTWCAFLTAMLYGIDTRAKTTKTLLADKERYAPWSGSPMSGRIDLNWDGRDITIERRTKGRLIFGDFKAYETETGLPVPELTAANCGQELLGVERSVFVRAGFLRLTDLPVTQDESLRRRLNALVTTGDESGAADRLAQKLKDLKNKCRFNKSGLLPQAEAQREELQGKLRDLEGLQDQSAQLRRRQETLEAQLAELENHQAALRYAAAQADAQRVAEAERAEQAAAGRLQAAKSACEALPPKAEALQSLEVLQDLQDRWNALQAQGQQESVQPQEPESIAAFRELSGEEAVRMAQADGDTYRASAGLRPYLPVLLMGLACAAAAAVLLVIRPVFAAAPGALLLACLALGLRKRSRTEKLRGQLREKYGAAEPDAWLELAKRCQQQKQAFALAASAYVQAQARYARETAALRQQIAQAAQGRALPDAIADFQQVVTAYERYDAAGKAYESAAGMLAVTRQMAKTAQPPGFPDTLTWDAAGTAQRISECTQEQRQLHLRLGQCLGQMERLGQEADLRRQLEAVNARIEKLEDMFAALTIAQQTLAEASAQLQRRFAPRISNRAQTLFGKLTGGRYDRLTLGEDLTVSAGAESEDTLHTAMWRSDGTVDQLYLALRLAVAEELTPQAPLVLDDALVRFDDARLEQAMEILQEVARTKQVILFTCQSREAALI